jgi:superfamily II DNA or RNA helicase
MPAFIVVTSGYITLAGLDRLTIRDTYYEAPEPPAEGDNVDDGIRTGSANLLFLHERFPDAIWNDPGNRLVEARAYRYLSRLRTAEPGEYERTWPFKVSPRPYQLKIFTHARHLNRIALSPVALGTGKSKMALDICADKFMRGEIDAVAIVAINSVKRQWIRQAVPEHMTDAVQWRAHIWKPTTIFPSNVAQAVRGERTLRIVAFNIEAFSRTRSKAFTALSTFLRSGRVALIFDESTRIKNYRAICTKEILKLRSLAAVRMILTGTPITKGLEDFFTQYQFLDENIIGLSDYFAFRARYCATEAIRGRNVDPRAVRIVGYRFQEELIRKIAPVSFMVPDTVLGLPPKRYERFEVEMTDEQEHVYRMLRDQLIEDLEAHRIENPLIAAVRMLRLQQVLCGRYYENVETEDDMRRTEARRIPSNRPEVLGSLLEQHDGQALVWCRFREDIQDIVEIVSGIGRVGIYEGETSQAERERQVRAFKDGALDYMILTSAGTTGVDGLQTASAAFYYSNSFNREHRWQSEGRIYRLGQQRSTLFGDLVVPNSIDTRILTAFAETADLARMVIANPHFLSGGADERPIPARPASNEGQGPQPLF